MSGIEALTGIGLNARDPEALADFFVRALGFRRTADGVALGATPVELTPASGAPYPGETPGWSPLFQHFAIVTDNMATALARLQAAAGWTAITREGPQTLPASSGGVTAYKFRDPEGHPLELLQFPSGSPGAAAGPRIDHSAISVRDTGRSLAFYTALGLVPAGGSLNQGPAQDRLDGLCDVRLDVTALRPAVQPTPHLELLGYRGDFPRGAPAAPGDVAATRLRFAVADGSLPEALRAGEPPQVVASRLGGSARLARDPDGHLLQFDVARPIDQRS